MMEMFDAELQTGNELTREHGAAEGRPIYRKISPLKDLAGITAAVTLYCPSFKKLAEWRALNTFKYRRNNDMICNLALPLSIQNMLGKYANYAIDEIIKWVKQQHSYSITYQTCAVLFNNHICEIVWKCDGEIDYRKTALKMLSNPDLEEYEKYKIAASHCLENHMRKMLPLWFVNKMESLAAISRSHTSIAYWYHFFKGDLYEMPDRYCLSESTFIKNWYRYNPYVIIYFWKRLPFEEQQRVAIDLIKNHRDPLIQKDLLLEMNATQQLSIIKKISVGKIIVNFTLVQHYSEYAVLTWEYIKNTINEEQYLDMLTDILLQAEKFAEDTANRKLIDVIDIMWKTTPSALKRYASDIKEGAVMNLLTSFNHRFHFGAQFAMLVSILPNIELCWRQNILDKISSTQIISHFLGTIWGRVIEETGRSLLFNKFVKLCIPNSEKQAEFKKKWIRPKFMNHYGIKLIKNGEWDELEEFITIFECNIIDIAEYKIHLLTNLVSDIDYRDDKDDWPYTPSHEWKRFCSGIDEESLIGVLTNFRRGANHLTQFTVLVNMLPNFEVDFRRDIVDKMMSSQNEDPNIFEKFIIWDRPLLLHKFIKLCFTSTQKQFEFKKKWISENVRKYYCAFLIGSVGLEKVDEFLALYPPNTSNNLEFMIELLNSCYAIENGFALLREKRWEEVGNIIERILPQTIQTVQPNIIMPHLRNGIRVSRNHFEEIRIVMNIVEFFLMGEDDVKSIKKYMIYSFRASALAKIFFHLSEHQWNIFLCWFLEDDESLLEFKCSLDLYVLDLTLKNYVCSYNLRYNDFVFAASSSKSLLRWYSGSGGCKEKGPVDKCAA